MNFSRKVILASCACAAFLSGVYSCTVDNLNVEEKEVFLCKTDDDCLSGSRCGGVRDPGDEQVRYYKDIEDAPESLKNATGRCILEKDIKNCSDYDGDGFSALDPLYRILHEAEGGMNEGECGTDSVPYDPDDTDPRVNANASEICDGKDNNGDGCIDGKCMCAKGESNCKCSPSDQTNCAAIVERCMGKRTLVDMYGTGCSAENAGAFVCLKKGDGTSEMVYAKATHLQERNGVKYYAASDFKEDATLKSCPTGVSSTIAGTNIEIITYNDIQLNGKPFIFVDNEKSLLVPSDTSDKTAEVFCAESTVDHDCNGKTIDDEAPSACKECDVSGFSEADLICFVNAISNDNVLDIKGKNQTSENRYKKLKDRCTNSTSEADCACLGHFVCDPSLSKTSPVCKNQDNLITYEWLKDHVTNNSNMSNDEGAWCNYKAAE